MNSLTYNLLDKINKPRILDDTYLKDLYEYYEYASSDLGFDVNITKEDFGKTFSIIYDVLMLKVDEETLEQLIAHYLKLIIADAVDGNNVDLSWFINYIWYFCAGVQDITDTKQYRDCILFLQQKLIKEFKIKENTKKKIKRKMVTRYMSGVN